MSLPFIESVNFTSIFHLSLGVVNLALFKKAVKWSAGRLLRCPFPVSKPVRRRLFVRFLTLCLKKLMLRTGKSYRKTRRVLRMVARGCDSLLDSLIELGNPLAFYDLNGDQMKSVRDILKVCDIQRPLPYELTFHPWSFKEVTKVSEGSYGEIYFCRNFKDDQTVLKVVTVYGRSRDDPKYVADLQDAVPEAVCTRYLSTLARPGKYYAPNFPKAHGMHMLKGKAPQKIVKAWEDGTEESSHPKPDRYSKDSLFLVMELENCGVDIVDISDLSGPQALSLVLQTASALAVAEDAFQFEHRDLHSGNLLYRRIHATSLIYSIPGLKWKVPTFNVKAYIIDFSMSRICVDGDVYALDLSYLESSDKDADFSEFFNHQAVYVWIKNEFAETDFQAFKPSTNIKWLCHLCGCICRQLQRRLRQPTCTREDKEAMKILLHMKTKLMSCSRIFEFLAQEVFLLIP